MDGQGRRKGGPPPASPTPRQRVEAYQRLVEAAEGSSAEPREALPAEAAPRLFGAALSRPPESGGAGD